MCSESKPIKKQAREDSVLFAASSENKNINFVIEEMCAPLISNQIQPRNLALQWCDLLVLWKILTWVPGISLIPLGYVIELVNILPKESCSKLLYNLWCWLQDYWHLLTNGWTWKPWFHFTVNYITSKDWNNGLKSASVEMPQRGVPWIFARTHVRARSIRLYQCFSIYIPKKYALMPFTHSWRWHLLMLRKAILSLQGSAFGASLAVHPRRESVISVFKGTVGKEDLLTSL